MDAKEVKDTVCSEPRTTTKLITDMVIPKIVVAWPPQEEANEDKASGPKTTQASITVAATNNSTAPRRPLPSKRPSATACGFCRPFLKPNEPCRHMVGKSHGSVRREKSITVALAQKRATRRKSK